VLSVRLLDESGRCTDCRPDPVEQLHLDGAGPGPVPDLTGGAHNAQHGPPAGRLGDPTPFAAAIQASVAALRRSGPYGPESPS
jgi:hypothetical protein